MRHCHLKKKIISMYKIYIPTGVVGVATIGSIVGSTIMSNRAQASIMSMAVIADQGWKKIQTSSEICFRY